MNRTNVILSIVITILLLLIGIGGCQYLKQQHQAKAQVDVLNDSLTITRDKYGRETASTSLILTDYATFKALHLAKEDSLGKQLQQLVSHRTISATIVTEKVVVDTVYKTTTILPGKDSCKPIYKLVVDEEWRKGTIIAGADSFKLDLVMPEKLVFQQAASKWRLFKPTTYTTQVTNSNPAVQITGLRTYTVQCDCKKKSLISFGIGTAIGLPVGYLIGRH